MMSSVRFQATAALLLVLIQPIAGAAAVEPNLRSLLSTPSDIGFLEFEAYAKKFDRKYEHDSKEYWLRRGLFEKRNAAAKAHNAKNRLWKEEAGQFADFTEEEQKRMLGYKSKFSHVTPSAGGAEMPAVVIAARELLRPIQGNATMPAEFDWMHLNEARQVPDQGMCGSCWAVASKSVLDAHHEIYATKTGGTARNFSAQQLVSCIPNLRACGGTGGCGGSTVELAYDWVLHNGCADEETVPYKAHGLSELEAKCKDSRALSSINGAVDLHETPSGPAALGGALFGMQGYHMLERNKEKPLVEALYQHGPVAISVMADLWFGYASGIFEGCPKDGVVNHAVTLYGYGNDANEDEAPHEDDMPVLLGGVSPSNAKATRYWLIRNSWAKTWGENGFIRMKRLDDEDSHCGKDDNNLEGTGCKGDPSDKSDKGDATSVTVCGNCGFLWDSVVPHFYDPDTVQSSSLAAKSKVEVDASAHVVRRHL